MGNKDLLDLLDEEFLAHLEIVVILVSLVLMVQREKRVREVILATRAPLVQRVAEAPQVPRVIVVNPVQMVWTDHLVKSATLVLKVCRVKMENQGDAALTDVQGRREPKALLVFAVIQVTKDLWEMRVQWDRWDHLVMMLMVLLVLRAKRVNLADQVQEDQLVIRVLQVSKDLKVNAVSLVNREFSLDQWEKRVIRALKDLEVNKVCKVQKGIVVQQDLLDLLDLQDRSLRVPTFSPVTSKTLVLLLIVPLVLNALLMDIAL